MATRLSWLLQGALNDSCLCSLRGCGERRDGERREDGASKESVKALGLSGAEDASKDEYVGEWRDEADACAERRDVAGLSHTEEGKDSYNRNQTRGGPTRMRE